MRGCAVPDPAGYESFGRNPSKWPAALLAADKDRVMRSNEKLVLTKIDLCEGLGICPRAVQSYCERPADEFPQTLARREEENVVRGIG